MPSVAPAPASAVAPPPPAPSQSRPLPPLTPISTSLLSSRFTAWYPTFRKVSPKATILDVSSIQPDFFDWLEEDGLVLPRGSGAGVVGGEADESDEDPDQDVDDLDGDQDEDQDDEEEGGGITPARDFSVLDEKIRQVIQKYDGEVFPKLDWSAPRDAAWILPGQTLKCSTPADVYLLLKSSDFVGKDLNQLDELKQRQQQQEEDSGSSGVQVQSRTDDSSSVQDSMASLTLNTHSTSTAPTPTSTPRHLNLIIKRHFNLNPSHEFRCFVRANQFVAITQRDATTYYSFLQDPSTRRDIQKKLLNFWSENLRNRHAVDDYIFDVYFTRDRSRVFLMDVNPYLPRTDAILWDWDELEKRAKRSWATVHGLPLSEDSDEEEEENQSDDEDDDDDTGSSAASFSSSSRSSSPDPRGEPFIRIYTDGRPPTTHYQAHPPPRTHRTLPSLRLIRSERESSAAGGPAPMYATNMVPKDIIDVSNGNGVEEFARVWREQQQQQQ